MMTRPRKLAVAIVCASLGWSAQARAGSRGDAVVDWNAITSDAVDVALAATPPRPGPATALDFAIVHAAIYDAVQAIEGDFEPLIVDIDDACGSPAAATAKAAHDVLVDRFPSQAAALDTIYHQYLADHGIDEDDPGVAVGRDAAAAVIVARADDGSFPDVPPPPFVGGTEPGVWRPTPNFQPGPPGNAPMLATWLATVTPYTLTDPAQFRAQPPPALTSARYARHYAEVKALGSITSVRTPEQNAVANFWFLNFGRQWNLAVRDIATAHVHRISDSSRLFALVNIATADAVITAWDSKLPPCRRRSSDGTGDSPTLPRRWSTRASTTVCTSASPTPRRDSRDARSPAGSSGTSCGRSAIARSVTTAGEAVYRGERDTRRGAIDVVIARSPG